MNFPYYQNQYLNLLIRKLKKEILLVILCYNNSFDIFINSLIYYF